MANAYIQSNQVLEVDGNVFGWPTNPNGVIRTLPVENTVVVGAFWHRPITQSSNLLYYADVAVDPASPTTKPTPDSVKVLRLKNDVSTRSWAIAITDTDQTSSGSQWALFANGTGGTLPVMPTVTIAPPIFQNGPVSTLPNGSNIFLFEFPANPQGLLYTVFGAWFNGVAPAQAYQPSGITTLAQFATWANTALKWPMYGTWSAPSANILKLISPIGATIPVKNAGVINALTSNTHTLDMTVVNTPAAVNGVGMNGGVRIPFKGGAFMVTSTPASMQALINEITKIYQPNQITMVISGTNIVATTEMGVIVIYNDATAVITSS